MDKDYLLLKRAALRWTISNLIRWRTAGPCLSTRNARKPASEASGGAVALGARAGHKRRRWSLAAAACHL
jgi:hypothetical protein